ncbi:MAG: hypothetical protein II399_08785, partial [Lachnospiraceae bacterium]|nr:hypothetical protein [Lachnospiraceae bacterium]
MITKDIEYLIGVDEKHIADFDAMKEKYGTEFRNLNILRSAIISNFHEVNDAYKDGTSLSDIDVTASVVKDLSLEYFFDRKDKSLSRYVIWINKRIESQCPEFSDSEINPEWIKNMFTMENGDTVEGVQAAVTRYTQFRQYYPFQKYINWDFSRTKEEIRKKYFLKTDEDFSNNLERYYAQDNSWVDFTSNGRKSTVVIDCENGNPSATVAALLPISDRLEKVVLINDDCASGLWSEFQKKLLLEGVFVCEEKLPRLKAQKSLVDLRMAARILEE